MAVLVVTSITWMVLTPSRIQATQHRRTVFTSQISYTLSSSLENATGSAGSDKLVATAVVMNSLVTMVLTVSSVEVVLTPSMVVLETIY